MDDEDDTTRPPTLKEVLKRVSSGLLEAVGLFSVRVYEAFEPVTVVVPDLFEELFGKPDDDDEPIVASETIDDDDLDGGER